MAANRIFDETKWWFIQRAYPWQSFRHIIEGSEGRTVNSASIKTISYGHVNIVFPFPLEDKKTQYLSDNPWKINDAETTWWTKSLRDLKQQGCTNAETFMPKRWANNTTMAIQNFIAGFNSIEITCPFL